MAEDQTDAPVEPSVDTDSTSLGDSTDSTDGGSWSPEQQAAYTKKTQALAEERKAWDSQRTQQAQQLQQYANQLKQQQQQYQQQVQQYQQQQQAGQQQSLVEQLEGMEYLDGKTAAQLVQRIVGEGSTPMHQQLQQSQQIIAQLHQQNKTLQEQFGQNQGKQAERELEAKFAELRSQHNLPDDEAVTEFMRDVYFSHEGDDLSEKYPDMLGQRLDGLRKAFRDMDRRAAAKAKESPFPSRGGESSLTSGKTGGYKDPQARADELWPMINPGQTE